MIPGQGMRPHMLQLRWKILCATTKTKKKKEEKKNKPEKQLREEMDEGCFMVRGNRKRGWGRSFGELRVLTEFWPLIIKAVHLQGC